MKTGLLVIFLLDVSLCFSQNTYVKDTLNNSLISHITAKVINAEIQIQQSHFYKDHQRIYNRFLYLVLNHQDSLLFTIFNDKEFTAFVLIDSSRFETITSNEEIQGLVNDLRHWFTTPDKMLPDTVIYDSFLINEYRTEIWRKLIDKAQLVELRIMFTNQQLTDVLIRRKTFPLSDI